MDSFVINKSAFQSPVVNIENGETIGLSSIAIFQKKDLHMAFLVVNTTEDIQDETPQILIPFTDVASINKYSISVWLTNLTDSDRKTPLSPETYMQLIEAPVCRNNVRIGKVSSAVLSLEGDLLSIEVESGGKTKKYSRNQLSRKGSSIIVAEEEETVPVLKAIPEIQPETASTKSQKDERDEGSLENLIKTVSKQISTLTDYIIDSRREDNKENSLSLQPKSEIHERSFGKIGKPVSRKSTDSSGCSIRGSERESEGLPVGDMVLPDDYSKIGANEKTDTFFADTCFPEIMKKLDRIEGKIDLLSIKSYPEPNESADFLEDFSDEKINGLYDIAKKVADNQEPDISVEFDLDTDEDADPNTRDYDSYSLKQPMSEEEKDNINGDSRVHIENFMEELAMLARMDSDETDEPINPIEEPEAASKKIDEEPKMEKTQTPTKNHTYWKTAGVQAFSAIVFAAACIAMELINLF